MNVVWSNRAVRSLADIHSHIASSSQEAANRTIDGLLKRGDQLASFPKLGRVVDRYKRPGIRELVEAPYRIIYRVRRKAVEVIDVFHSAPTPSVGTLRGVPSLIGNTLFPALSHLSAVFV